MAFKREVKCQICSWRENRTNSPKGCLVDPCPECGSRVTYATHQDGDQPVTPDPQLGQK